MRHSLCTVLSGLFKNLVVHWIRISLPMQGTQVVSLGREDSTCHGKSKPVSHDY